MPPIETVDDDAHRFIANRAGPWAPSAETEALRRLPSDTVERAFAALPPDWRLVVLLADIEELSYREIASIMEIPPADGFRSNCSPPGSLTGNRTRGAHDPSRRLGTAR
jgi:hypothetical protein